MAVGAMNSSVIVISNRILSVGFTSSFASRLCQAAIEVRQNQVPAVRLAITVGSPGRVPRPGLDRECDASAIWAPKRKDDTFRSSGFAARRCAPEKVLTTSICCSGNLCRGPAQLDGREAVALATSTDSPTLRRRAEAWRLWAVELPSMAKADLRPACSSTRQVRMFRTCTPSLHRRGVSRMSTIPCKPPRNLAGPDLPCHDSTRSRL